MSNVSKVVATKSFESAVKSLKKDHKTQVLAELHAAVLDLVNLRITKQKSNHPLNRLDGHRDIHLDGGRLILLYRYDEETATLFLSLRLQDVVDHKELTRYDRSKLTSPATEYDVDSILSANYGGAYDIDPDSFFTRDDLTEFGESTAELLRVDTHRDIEYNGAWIDDNVLSANFVVDGDMEIDTNLKLDMRKIRKPSDLISKYSDPVATQVKVKIKEYEPESVESATSITADWYEQDEPDYVEFDDVEETIHIDLNGIQIEVQADGHADFVSTDWSHNITVDGPVGDITLDSDMIEDDVWDMVTDMLPEFDHPATYTLFGTADLTYYLSDITGYEEETLYRPTDWDDIHYVLFEDDIGVDLVREQSTISEFRYEESN